eukprot:c22032_g1_i2 orf=303-1649(+)
MPVVVVPEENSSSPPSRAYLKQDSKSSSSERNHDEYVYVDLSDIRKDVQCPICLGIIRKTRTVMECLHRFCRECIDKSMRLGNNECPVCRTHCASRRSLRDDLNFDALIAALYPDLDSYEEQELALREEDECRNRQLQASIAELSLRQSDALARRCTTTKSTGAAIVHKVNGKLCHIQNWNQGRNQGQDHRYSCSPEDEELLDLQGAGAEQLEDVLMENRLRKRKRRTSNFLLDTSRAEMSSDDEHAEQDKALDLAEERVGRNVRIVTMSTADENGQGLITWARAGIRSHIRYGNLSNNSRHIPSLRATVLLESIHAAACQEIHTEFDVHLILQPFDQSDNKDKLPTLEKPNLCCPAGVTVQHICKFLDNRLGPSTARELEILVGKPSKELELMSIGKRFHESNENGQNRAESSRTVEVLHPCITLGQIHRDFWDQCGNLVLMYRCKA